MGQINLFEEVKRRADLLHLVENFAEGKISGNGNKRQLSVCPFCKGHGCFSISLEIQLFNCFQCPSPGSGGDIFTFMLKLRGYDRFSALKEIAELIGYALPEKSKPSKRDIRDEIALKLKTDWNLPEANVFWEYLTVTRKLSPDVLSAHDIGFYRGRQEMMEYLRKKGFGLSEIKSSGILTRNFGEFYKIIFSWRGRNGKVEGFVGAATKGQLERINRSEKDLYPKYKKNYDFQVTAPFNHIFAKRWVPTDRALIFVEGIVDCLHLLSIGIKNVIALGGSAFDAGFIGALQTTDYERFIFLFDADPAGTKATRRTMQIIWENGAKFSLYVAQIVYTDPDDDSRMIKDPDELIKKLGPDVMRSVVQDPVRAGSWLVGVLWDENDMKNPLVRDQVLEEIGGLWGFIEDVIEKKEMLIVLSKACGVPQDSLLKTIEKHGSAKLVISTKISPLNEQNDLSSRDKGLIKQLKEDLSEVKKEVKLLKQEKKLLFMAYASFVTYIKVLARARQVWHISRISDGHVYLIKLIKKKSEGVPRKIKQIEQMFSKVKLNNPDQIQKELTTLLKENQEEDRRIT